MNETITFRPSKANYAKITKYLEKEKKRRVSSSINNTIEQIILEHKSRTSSRIIVRDYNNL